MTDYRVYFSLFCLVAFLSCGAIYHTQATNTAQPQEVEAAPDLSQQILGAWVLMGRPNAKVEPKPGARMKFFSRHHWFITQHDPDTGKVMYHHGGTYTLDGNKYLEKVTFAIEDTMQLVGSEFHFTINIEDDKYTQVGENNPYTEAWKRPAQ